MIKKNVVIDKPIEEVFDYITNISNLPKWETNILEAEQTSEGEMGIGTKSRGVAKSMGMKMKWTSEVTEFENNKRWEETVTTGSSKIYEKLVFMSEGKGTRISLTADMKMGGLLKLLSPLMIPAFSKQLKTNLSNLKRILEAS